MHGENSFCFQMAPLVDFHVFQFSLDAKGLLVRTSWLSGAPNWSCRSFWSRVSFTLRTTPSFQHTLAGADYMILFDAITTGLMWALMRCKSYEIAYPARVNERSGIIRTGKWKFFVASSALQYAAMDLVGSSTSTKAGNTRGLVMADLFSMLTRLIPLWQTTARFVATTYINDEVIPYCIPDSMFTDSDPQLTDTFSRLVCKKHSAKHQTNTTYHPLTKERTKRYNQAPVTQLRQFVS